MNDKDLQQLTESISMEYFKRPFLHRAFFNPRLRTTGGRYSLGTHDIEINPRHFEYFGEEEVVSIIKHELCHYHLHILGMGYQHKDEDFKLLLKQVGGSRHCKTIPNSRSTSSKLHIYECESCALQFTRRRQMNTKKYVCGRCQGSLKKIVTKTFKKPLTVN
ncbi:SprT family protein [Paenalkalicoccus suaedae]|uniref:Protein SprT-like n=1 Tax=Paenalkalicoccus suaedae TaxID=2592382 RepID=A0A859FBU6_9BACI|nr:SprT family protein [Paenalkalicoccus suaedae]QKS70201.1 SprT family protein [Paenalkalicoccus suaedae]